MPSMIGSAIVAVLGLLAMLWLPSRILGVWRGDRAAPDVPLRRKHRYFLGRHVFDVTDRNFPAFGAALFSIAGFALFFGLSGVATTMGYPGLSQPLVMVGVAMLVLSFVFAIIAQVIFLVGRPKTLTPPAQRRETTS